MEETSDTVGTFENRHRSERLAALGKAGMALMAAGALTFSLGFMMTTRAAGSTDGSPVQLALGALPPQAPVDPTETATALPTETPEPTATPEAPTATPEPPAPEPPTAVPTRAVARPTSTPRPAPTQAPAPPPSAVVSLGAMEQTLFNLHNVERRNAGLSELRLDPTLEAIARQRAQDMASKNYFSHTSPSGETAFSIMAAMGYTYSIAGENIARNNYPDDQAAATAMSGFMNSPSHRQNILDGRYTGIGVALAFGADGMKYFAVAFAGH